MTTEGRRDGEGGIRIEGAWVRKWSLALFQNAVPALRELAVVNDSAREFPEAVIEISSEPPVFEPRTWRLQDLRAGGHRRIDDLALALDGARLSRLTEAEPVFVAAEVRSGGEVLARTSWDVELLPRNQFGGIGHFPEMVAAFVRPNDPAVDPLLASAAAILRTGGRSGSLDGYERGRSGAWEIASAIWSALGGLGISYALPPASFETLGQRVRSPTQILEGKVATCLDLALLFASMAEQAGLHPIVVFTEGHALPGVWLRREEFSAPVVDDVTALRKRIKLQEIILFESTLICHRPPPPFSAAVDRGAREAGAASPVDGGSGARPFELAVDVASARAARIKPLGDPSAGEPGMRSGTVPADVAAPALDPAPDLPEDLPEPGGETPPATPDGRLDRWQRRLLDLSLRNNLLNFRRGRRAIPLLVPDPSRLEDLLADGRTFSFAPRREMSPGGDPRSGSEGGRAVLDEAERAQAVETLERGELAALLSRTELETALVELYRHTVSTLQETGSNTLFLAFGFLAWTRDGAKGRRYLAPILLVPAAITRKTVRTGFKIALHDDDPRLNPTLVEMLRKDFHLGIPLREDDLPADGSGLDVKQIWRTVSEAVKDLPGFEVVEDVTLAPFSFGKHLMWKDLVDRTGGLRQCDLVRHLLDSPRDPFASETQFPDPGGLDETLDPGKTFCPLPADSSQLAAVVAAARGKDFVLVGPPGTGKSQTIANLIAQCLAEGKSVLFVCEKAAALSVVSRRMRDVGLSEFCLEVHSHKARKLDVLDQLRRAWETRADDVSRGFESEAARIKNLRGELNRFVQRLHMKRENGLSVFDAMGVVAGAGLHSPVRLQWPDAASHDAGRLERFRDVAKSLAVRFREVAAFADGPLRCVETEEWSHRWQEELLGAADGLGEAAVQFETAAAEFARIGGFSGLRTDWDGSRCFALLAAVLPAAAGRDWRFALRPDGAAVAAGLARGCELVRRGRQAEGGLSVPYGPEARRLDLDALDAAWREAARTWWPRSFFLRRSVRKALAVAADRASGDPAADLALLLELREIEAGVQALESLTARAQGLWAGRGTDVEEAEDAVRFQAELARALALAASRREALSAMRRAVEHLLGEGNALLAAGGAFDRAGRALGSAAAALQSAIDRFAKKAGRRPDSLREICDGTPEALRLLAEGVRSNSGRLHAWCSWRSARSEAVACGLQPLVNALETGTADPAGIPALFEHAYFRNWLGEVVDGDEVLRTFSSAEHERRIEEFRLADDRFRKLTGLLVRARLCAGLPAPEDVKRASGWGLLRREIEKKRRHLPVRELIARAPEAIRCLAPCLLMSPLSVAQYLSADAPSFDVVVFDEASQIPTWDAIGAMARGRRVVMVGDPKQLPPTSFFERGESEDDLDIEDEADLESILDECLGANVPASRLAWHYRSRHESLIAFSNHRYYDGSLVTFPSPSTEDRAVRLVHVEDGVYDRGGSRTNPNEARALVAEVAGRLKDPLFAGSGLTIGIVTFNAEQQRLIEDLLDRERSRDPSIEPFFSESNLESLFVKNLENVQGDERDVIFFSVTYGPDSSGAVTMNFGPLNKSGGERRLNVAVTRARHELVVYASLRPDQIDLGRTRAEGARDFKHFLEYAERGAGILLPSAAQGPGRFASAFEEAVARALAGRGYQVRGSIGVSSLRVDLGVVHPDFPEKFLAGIECDGENYRRSPTARDRDKVRRDVLAGLGWDLVRIWSSDWWRDPAGSLDRLASRLDRLLAESRSAAGVPDPPEIPGGDIPVDGDGGEPVPDLDPAPQEPPPEDPDPSSAVYRALAEADLPAENAEDAVREGPPDEPSAALRDSPAAAFFAEANPLDAAPGFTGSAFDDPAREEELRSMIRLVVEVEGPVREDVLARRIARALGWRRTGSRIGGRILDLAAEMFPRTVEEDGGAFLWPGAGAPPARTAFRPPRPGESRSADEVALPELLDLAAAALAGSSGEEEALRRMARDLGLLKLGSALRARLLLALDLVRRGDR